ncbi:MAG: dihydroorotate dehydrogenase-like protein [bacterium]|jgi:dihydroorotate dehydrogenase (fumarate)|nr:dihydroorotate dehydrogenase-like protein [bacterium]MDD3625536.1 dihydroorotate dehydrogenase-like protein [Proteiniphilum sp.]MDD3967628.1 dihydroorotate dehydrogenase-like protein [Proteiniphilum sp.]
MVTLETTFAGLQLKNPLIAASSGLTNSLKKIKELEDAGIGAVVLKSLFEEQIESHSGKLAQLTDYPEAADYINTYVEMNHMEKYLDLIRSTKAECEVPVVASINCYKQSRWIDFARSVQDAGADALELNLFLLNAGEYGDTWLEESYVNIVRELKRNLSIPLVIKMAKNISNLPGLVGRLKALGAAGVVLFNRFYQLDIDITHMEIVSGPVFSNPADFSDTLRWTAIVAGRVPDFDIACSYGVHSWEDAVKGILAGAAGVQLCSLLYQQDPPVIGEMLTCIEEWMGQNNYDSLDEFRGKLSYANIKNPSLYERVQFMKYFSDYKQ